MSIFSRVFAGVLVAAALFGLWAGFSHADLGAFFAKLSLPEAALSTGIVIMLAGIFIAFARHGRRKAQSRYENFFANRKSLNPDEFHEKYYADRGYRRDVVVTIKNVFAEAVTDFDLTRLSPTDDLSSDLNFIWEMDSMADVEIVVGLEKAFGVVISDAEADRMKTMDDVVEIISQKVKDRDSKD